MKLFKPSIPRQRKLNLERLERRNLLTGVVAPALPYWPQEQFIVRRDEMKPVELWIDHWQDPSSVDTGADQVSADEDQEISVPLRWIPEAESGTATLSDDGRSVLYQPAAGFIGIDVITLRDRDAISTTEDDLSKERRLAVNVVEPLLAVDDWFQVEVNSDAVELEVLANDIRNAQYIGTPPEFKLQDASMVGGGAVTLSEDLKELIYTPPQGFEGTQSIEYVAVDGDGYSMQGKVVIRVSNEIPEVLWPEQLRQQMIQHVVSQNHYRFGGPVYAQPEYRFLEDDAIPSVAVPADASGTNNQVSEVDESDRVKTDGEFLYVLSSPDQNDWVGWDIFPWMGLRRPLSERPEPSDGNLLTIVDVRQPSSPVIVSRQLFDDRVLSLDLQGDRLTVISQRAHQTAVTVMDVSEPSDTKNVWTTVVDGRFKQARRVGGTLYVFTNDQGTKVPPLEAICSDNDEFCFYETGRDYLQGFSEETLLETLFPSQQTYDSEGDLVAEVPRFLIDPLDVGLSRPFHSMNLIVFDTNQSIGGAIDWEMTDGSEHLLVTTESIYTTRTHYQSPHVFEAETDAFVGIPERPSITTEINRYALQSDGTIEHAAMGVVPGTLNNSFSMDEYAGLLRIATENSWWNAGVEDQGSNVYVLEQTDQSMVIVGGLQGLAPGEQIYAVRFAEERGYVVTFERVDPLFVIDLSVPTKPELLGQLKTPGYSQYLHVIGENHLIGIGRDADEETGLYGGLIVSLFDVSDPGQPVVQERYEFEGGRSTFSPFADDSPWALRDHHAISYFSDYGILALPIYSRMTGGLEGRDAPIFESTNESAVRTFQIDVDRGILELDSVPFDSRVDRTLRVGENLYSLSNDELKVTRLLERDQLVASLVFESDGQDDFFDVPVGESITLDVTGNDFLGGGELTVLNAELIAGDGSLEIVNERGVRFTPLDQRLTEHRIRYTARDAVGTLINAIATVDPDVRWQNTDSILDVNDDSVTSARDALNVINMLIRYGAVDCEEIEGFIGEFNGETPHYYFDTTGDRRLSGRDALLVINSLNASSGGEGQAEDSSEQFAMPIVGSREASGKESELLGHEVMEMFEVEGEEVATFASPVTCNHENVDLVLGDSAAESIDWKAIDQESVEAAIDDPGIG